MDFKIPESVYGDFIDSIYEVEDQVLLSVSF